MNKLSKLHCLLGVDNMMICCQIISVDSWIPESFQFMAILMVYFSIGKLIDICMCGLLNCNAIGQPAHYIGTI